MAHLVSPTKNQIAKLRTPLTAGEQRFLDVLEGKLGEDWEIYTQPHLNGCRPDFVVINPRVGIGVFEIKDWNLNAMHYEVINAGSPTAVLMASDRNGSFQCENPLAKVQQYKREIIDLYCPRLNVRLGLAAVTAGVVFPFIEQARLDDLLSGLPQFVKRNRKYDTIAGSEAVDAGDLQVIFPESALRSSSTLMSEAMAEDLRSWLIEPDYAAEQRDWLRFDSTQISLIETRTPTGYRRIRGPAGSGKSQVVAARAAILAAEGKDVLVVTYNITLLHYLRDLCVRVPGGRPNSITWLNFHQWCKRLSEHVMPDKYRDIWCDHFNERSDAFTEVPRALLNAINSGASLPQIYDAILVDEGQDFQPEWWALLRKGCKQGGEMVLVADSTQDVYGTANRWTEQVMTGAGFSGPWNELAVSYRLPPALADLAASFAKTFLPTEKRILPVAPQAELDLFPCELRWVQIRRDEAVDACVRELLQIIRGAERNDRAMADLTLLTDNVPDGVEVAKRLASLGIRTVDTFDLGKVQGKRRKGEDRRKKLAFRKGDARVKVTTLHSFKGWEGRSLVLNITRADSLRAQSLIYAGITRLKKHSQGSFLTVVCSDERLGKFGAGWPNR